MVKFMFQLDLVAMLVQRRKKFGQALEMNPDGSEQKIYASGLRNAVGLKWIGKFLFATNQGADHLGKNKPDETFYALKRDADCLASCYSSNR